MQWNLADFLSSIRAAVTQAISEEGEPEQARLVGPVLDMVAAYAAADGEAIPDQQLWQQHTNAAPHAPALSTLLTTLDLLPERIAPFLEQHHQHATVPPDAMPNIARSIRQVRAHCVERYSTQTHQQIAQLARSNQDLQRQLADSQEHERHLQQQIFDLEVLYDLTRKIGYTLNHRDLMHLIQENLHRALPYDVAVGLVFVENIDPEWVCRTSRPLSPALQAEITSHIRTVLDQFSFPTEQLIASTWTTRTSDPDAEPLDTLESVFLVPFLTQDSGELLGLLMVGAHQADVFSEAQVRLLYTVANQAIFSIQQLRNLLASEQKELENLVRSVPVGIMMLDPGYRVILTNPAAESYLSLLGITQIDGPLTSLGALPIEALVADGYNWEIATAETEPRILRITGSYIYDHDRYNEGWVLVLDDITERKQAEERIRYMALFDTLTDLPNRVLFRDRLKQAMAQAQRSGLMVSVLFLDLDRFKAINDTLGHVVGDQLLQIVAQRLRHCVRASDTVARLGGDEFTVILVGLVREQDAAHVAQKILVALAEPVYLDGRELYTTTSIGITFFPSDALDVDSLIKYADVAMYRAKSQGRNSYAFYTADMHVRALEWLTLERDLRLSIDRENFFLHYQPQINLLNRRMVGVEVLVRWQHPDMGVLGPNRFIPIAEETGLIVPLGRWILRTACLQNRAWQQAGLPPVRIAVNLSARQFAHPDLVSEIRTILQETGLDPQYLDLELTESTIMHDTETMIAHIHSLKALGVRFSIDDFGTGYSSLSYLKRLPIDTLKIDRSFVHDIPSDHDGAAIATTIIAMTQSLQLRVIAEGVENEHQATFLQQQGCNEIQGYLYSQPVSAEEITRMLQHYLPKIPS